VEARAALNLAPDSQRPRLREALARLEATVYGEKQAEVAREFDRVHSVERALEVGSLDAIIPAAELRPRLIEAMDRPLVSEATGV